MRKRQKKKTNKTKKLNSHLGVVWHIVPELCRPEKIKKTKTKTDFNISFTEKKRDK